MRLMAVARWDQLFGTWYGQKQLGLVPSRNPQLAISPTTLKYLFTFAYHIAHNPLLRLLAGYKIRNNEKKHTRPVLLYAE